MKFYSYNKDDIERINLISVTQKELLVFQMQTLTKICERYGNKFDAVTYNNRLIFRYHNRAHGIKYTMPHSQS